MRKYLVSGQMYRHLPPSELSLQVLGKGLIVPPKYKHVRAAGFTFLFKYDQVDSSLLHIYARHLMTIDDALELFFSQTPTWNEEYRRFENYSDTQGLYWFWRNESKKEVGIITCFRI